MQLAGLRSTSQPELAASYSLLKGQHPGLYFTASLLMVVCTEREMEEAEGKLKVEIKRKDPPVVDEDAPKRQNTSKTPEVNTTLKCVTRTVYY